MPRHLREGVGDRFEASVLGVRATSLEGHHERLPGGVHDRVAHLEAAPIEPLEDLQADARPALGTGTTPRGKGRQHRPKEDVEIGPRVANVEAEAEG